MSETLSVKIIKDLFPFFIAIDSDMGIISIGKSMSKIIPELTLQKKFPDYFEIRFPLVDFSFESIQNKIEEIFIIRTIDGQSKFRGQMYFEEECGFLFFMGTPIINSTEDFSSSNLTINDFARYDVLPDYLLALQAQNASHEKIELMAKKLVLNSDKLKESNIELKRFAYVASHDLQTPLRSIISFSQLLQKRFGSVLGQEGQEFLIYIIDGTKRMKNLISDLLSYSRISNKESRFVQTDLNKTLANVRLDLNADIQNKKAKIIIHKLPNIYIDPFQIHQLFQNLIGNAIKFNISKTPKVIISTEEKEKEYIFSVADNGIGMSMDMGSKIFEVFQRLNHIKNYEGTGIGLTICKKVVERHLGRIWIKSSLGEGTTFYFTINKKLGTENQVLISKNIEA